MDEPWSEGRAEVSAWAMKQPVSAGGSRRCREQESAEEGSSPCLCEPNTMVFGHASDLNELQLFPSSWCKPL